MRWWHEVLTDFFGDRQPRDRGHELFAHQRGRGTDALSANHVQSEGDRTFSDDEPGADSESKPELVFVPWDELPGPIREAIGPNLPPGHAVYAVPGADERGQQVTEWLWMDQDGELVDALWVE